MRGTYGALNSIVFCCVCVWIDHVGLQLERKQNDKKQAMKNKFLNRKYMVQEIRSAYRLEQCQGCWGVTRSSWFQYPGLLAVHPSFTAPVKSVAFLVLSAFLVATQDFQDPCVTGMEVAYTSKEGCPGATPDFKMVTKPGGKKNAECICT